MRKLQLIWKSFSPVGPPPLPLSLSLSLPGGRVCANHSQLQMQQPRLLLATKLS